MAEKDEIIKIDILSEENFTEKYNEDEISTELINYLIEQYILAKDKKKVKILINNKCNIHRDFKEMIEKGLKREFDKSLNKHHFYDLEQTIFSIVGIAILLISTIFVNLNVVKEILIIIAWVFIWEAVELELFEDHEGRKRRRFIKGLLKCKMELANNNNYAKEI